MNANEFRLGNILRDKVTGTLLAVDGLQGDSIDFRVINRARFPLPSGWTAERIPLCPEKIAALGFIPSPDGNRFYGYGVAIRVSTARPGSFVIAPVHCAALCFVKYVHELMNLVYAITQEEIPAEYLMNLEK